MNDFRWRNRARFVAWIHVSLSVIHGVYTTFLLLEKLGICSSFFDQDDPLSKNLTEIKKELYRIMKAKPDSPKIYVYLVRCLFFLYLEFRASCKLFRGTRLVTDTTEMTKAVERCQTWQKIFISLFFFSLFLGVPQSPRKWLSRSLNMATMGDDLKHFLFRVLLTYGFYNQVGLYISELQKKLRRRR